MFERFTDRARRVIVGAQVEARSLNHESIGTEHVLLGLAHVGSGVAARALESLGITGDAVRGQVEERTGRGRSPVTGHIPFTRQAKKALQLSLRETMRLGDKHIDTEHLLLGLVRDRESTAAQVLASLGAGPDRIRDQVIALLPGDHPGEAPGAGSAARRSGSAGRGKRALADLMARVESIDSRLGALERRVGAGRDVRDLDQEIAWVRGDKELAIDARDFEAAAALHDREERLLREKAALEPESGAEHAAITSLIEEVGQLRDLLRHHGIEPQDGAA